MDRRPGPSARLKLTLSYAGFVLLAGSLLLAAIGWFMLQQGWLQTNAEGSWRQTPGTDFVRGFAPLAATVLVFLLVFGLVGGWILAGRMLAPLTRITDATRLAAHGSLTHRIRLPGRRDEFRELADAFDGMLARLEAHVAEQRRFAANASHELRTPLATTQTVLDVALSDRSQDPAEVYARLRAINTRAIDLTEALLVLSRADQGTFTREPVDLSLLAEEATETLLPLAEKRGIGLTVAGGIAPAFGSHALLLQVTTNLVHNAIVHNLPENGQVWVTAAAGPGQASLTVENTGARLSPEQVASFAEPFRRGTERIHDDQAGVGLGLAIVQRITEAHEGSLTIGARPEGGLRVVVRLPPPPPHAPPATEQPFRVQGPDQ
ncbi:sensor histidine kinase [Streptomyces sp. KLOTTS4A1]|uniref:sensor histidine kinase n=1 Tax=Streptomyces sp. KLOTTS4A1 TaxID=3390996 RepID=UPI0039F54B57